MQTRYEAVIGFNTKQFWVYDSEKNVYIDPPEEVLDSLPDWREFPDEAEKVFQEVIDQNPNWLNDSDYWYDADETEI